MEASVNAPSPPSSAAESSHEDVRSVLFAELREKGLLDSVKAQLRGKVVQELQSLARDRPRAGRERVGVKRWERLSMSVVGEYLEMMGLEYTLSVMMIEAATSKEGMMGRGEVEEILGIRVGGRESMLTALIEETAMDRGIKKRSHTDKDGLEEKLQEIERAYSELSEKERECGHLSMQEKMLSYQRECQRRANEQVRADMSRFKERELASLRLESEDRLQEELRKSRREFEVFYQERLKALQQRERKMMDGMKNRETELDATLYAQRQKILDELEAVKNRELQLRRQFETEERGVLGERERLRYLEQELKLKEMSLENVNKLKDTEQNELLMVKQVQLEREFEEKRKSIEIQEATLREERRSLSQLEGICSQQMKETSELRTQLYKLQEAVRISTEAQFSAEREKQDIVQRVEKMGDYNLIKSENIRLENQVYLVRREVDKKTVIHEERVKDYESRIAELRTRLHQPTEEVNELRNRLLLEKQIREKERVLNHNASRQLELRLETSEQQHKCLKETLRDHQTLVKQLTEELTELKVRTANIPRSRTGHFDPQPLKSSLRPQPVYSAPSQYTQEYPDHLHRPKSSRVRIKLPPPANETMDVSHSLSEISFVQEAKSSLERLEREAQELEQSYKNVHNRILKGATMDNPIQSILSQFQHPFTSTIDPSTIPDLGVGRHLPTTSLSSLTDLNLSVGINQSLISETDKYTDLVSSYTAPVLSPQNGRYLSTITEPFDNALDTSILPEISQFETMDHILDVKNAPLDPPSEISQELSEILEENTKFHTLVDPAPKPDIIRPVKQPIEMALEPSNTVDTIQTNGRITSPINDTSHIHSSTPPGVIHKNEPWITDAPVSIEEPMENMHTVGSDNRPLSTPIRRSERDREREEAVNAALEEAERIKIIESEMQGFDKIPDTDTLPVQSQSVDDPIIFTSPIKITSDTILSPLKSGRSIADTILSPLKSGTPIPDTIISPLKSGTPIPNIISPLKDEPPVKPVETIQQIEMNDPMATYMHLLKSTMDNDGASIEEVNEELGGCDASLKSEDAPVSFAGFSDAEQPDPFADW